MRVTAIERQPRRQRGNVFLEGRFAVALSLEVIAEAGLRSGDDLSPERLEALREADVRRTALHAALRLLAYRPRSESELRERLARRGLPAPVIDDTVARVREQGLLDDAAFAAYWVESRSRMRPRSRRLLARELSAKGVERRTALRAAEAVNDAEAAYEAGSRRLRALSGLDYREFRRRLGDLLLRRGFDYETAREAVERLWREASAGAPAGHFQ